MYLLSHFTIIQAAKAYEDHQAKNGKPDSHAMAKELVYVPPTLYDLSLRQYRT